MAYGCGFTKDINMRIKDFFKTIEVSAISTSPLHQPATPEMFEYMQQRNEEKRMKSIELLGNKWLLHPSNKVQRAETKKELHK